MARRETGQWHAGRYRVAVDSEVAQIAIRPVQHNIVRADKPRLGHDLEAQTQNVAPIYGVWVRVAYLQRRNGGARAVETLLLMGHLLIRFLEELCDMPGIQ